MLSCNCANYATIVQTTHKLNSDKEYTKMPHSPRQHILQPKHSILKSKETEELLKQYNISLAQLPKIKVTDAALPEGANIGDVIKIERDEEDGKHVYFRVVVV